MSLKAGIVGLPNVGKSTLFNAITNSKVEAANYPFATIEPNVGVVELADKRLDFLASSIQPEKVIPATFEFIDIAGLVAGASKGEGLGNKFLAHIREVDAIVQVIRCFEDDEVTHVANSVDPIRDVEIINTELLLADLETIENVLNRVKRKAENANDKKAAAEFEVAQKVHQALLAEKPARSVELSTEEFKVIKSYQLLTIKPIIYVGNVAEKYVSQPEESDNYQKLTNYLKKNKAKFLAVSTQIEREIVELPPEDKSLFLADLGIKKSGLEKLTRSTFELLDLRTYFTAGKKEVRAWIFKQGMKAPQCAGIIHSDFERGFIKAEVISYDDFKEYNGELGAKTAGKNRLEGKDYFFSDGDIANFKFNV